MTIFPRLSAARAAGAALGLALGVTAPATAETHLLVMGGGSKPSSNQVSLEKNVNYFYRVIERIGLGNAQRDILFACGDDPTKDDVQYIATASDDPDTMRLIEVLIGPGKGQSMQYRPHDIGGGEAMSSRDNIVAWFDRHREGELDQLNQDDQLLVYFTGHGGRGPKDDKQNTSLYLWPNHNIRMNAFTQELDKLDPDTPVVMVMVQCFSGGFANVIFNEGDPARGLSEHNRCGFFAAVHSRTAAGCTPNVNEADYKEYSSYFWAALCGEDRLGVGVDRPDYNSDGQTDYLEAHAYAMIHSDSTDLSMTTSDRLVRAIEVPDAKPGESRLSQDSAYPDLYDVADPARRAILDGLSERLGLTGDNRSRQAREALNNARRQRIALSRKQRTIAKELAAPRTELTEKLTERWPELSDRKDPAALACVVEHAGPIRQAIAGEDAFATMIQQLDELASIRVEREALTATIAHAERFLYTCETLAKTDTLLRFGKPEYYKAYYDLLAREMATPMEE